MKLATLKKVAPLAFRTQRIECPELFDHVAAMAAKQGVECPVNSSDCYFIIRELAAAQVDKFSADLLDENQKVDYGKAIGGARAKFVAACLVDDDGKPLYTTQEQVRQFGELMPNKVMQKLLDACNELNGRGKEGDDPVEVAEGN